MLTLNEALKIAGLPLKEDYDRNQSRAEAQTLVKLIKDQFSVPVDTKFNSDGSVTITVNNGSLAKDSENSNPYAVTAKNLSSLIDKPFREFRREGWAFTQPIKGSFTIGVK